MAPLAASGGGVAVLGPLVAEAAMRFAKNPNSLLVLPCSTPADRNRDAACLSIAQPTLAQTGNWVG